MSNNTNRSTAAVFTLTLALTACTEEAASKPQLRCEDRSFEVRLSDGAAETYKVVGELCANQPLRKQTLQITLSGAGYGPVYWDFPYQPETYSYVKAAQAAGYATLNLSRIGIGRSDLPPSDAVTVEAHAHVLHDVIAELRAESEPFGNIITVGHSLGSVIAIAHAAAFPNDVNGVVLTGFVHALNDDGIVQLAKGAYPAMMDPLFADARYDEGYLTSRPGTRKDVFYWAANSDDAVIARDEETKQTLTQAELSSMPKYYGEQSRSIRAPVLLLIGDRDGLGCGSELDCADQAAVRANERAFFAKEACLEVGVLAATGHNANLHRGAKQTFASMNEWADRVIGNGVTGEPQGCSASAVDPSTGSDAGAGSADASTATDAGDGMQPPPPGPVEWEPTGGPIFTCRYDLTVVDPPVASCIDYRESDGWTEATVIESCNGQFASENQVVGGATCASEALAQRCVSRDRKSGRLVFPYGAMRNICEGVLMGTYETIPSDGWPSY